MRRSRFPAEEARAEKTVKTKEERDEELELQAEEIMKEIGLPYDETNSDLLPRERRVVEEFIISLDKADAYRKGGYSLGPNDGLGAVHCLFSRPRVKAAIRKAMAARRKRMAATEDEVIAQIARIAFCDVTQAVEIRDGRIYVKDTKDMPEDVRLAISEITETVNAKNVRSVKVRFADRGKSLELLSRHLGILKDDKGSEDDGKDSKNYFEGVSKALVEDSALRDRLALLIASAAAGVKKGR